jgi:CRISPR-associated protein Cas2
MILVITENAPPALRGRLALCLVEVRAGVYVGSYGERVRDILRRTIEAGIGPGNALMAWSAPTEAGYDLWSHGPSKRRLIDLDGLKLVEYVDDVAEANLMLERVSDQEGDEPE